MIILRETGGYFSGGAKAFARKASDEDILLGRRCVAIRAVPDTEVCASHLTLRPSEPAFAVMLVTRSRRRDRSWAARIRG
jgi:hypothetical protein